MITIKQIKKTTAAIAAFGSLALILIMPMVVSAASSSNSSATTNGSTGGFNGVVSVIKNAINVTLPIIISLAVLYFVWGVFLYVRSDDTSKREEARSYIIWSVIFLTVMVSVWGLVNIIITTFSLDSKSVPPPPPIPEYSS